MTPIVVSSCGEQVSIPVESVELLIPGLRQKWKRKINLDVWQSIQLIATVLPENATNKKVVWSSSNNGKATVSQDGWVTTFRAGPVFITVTTEDGGYTDTCELLIWG